jgi:hypothetical protein
MSKVKYIVDVVIHIKTQCEVEVEEGRSQEERNEAQTKTFAEVRKWDWMQSSLGKEPGVSIEVGEVKKSNNQANTT